MKPLFILLLISGVAFAGEGRSAAVELMPEIKRLQAEFPLREQTIVSVIALNTKGWTEEPVVCRRIVIVDHGKDENVQTLQHEWKRLHFTDHGIPWNEETASRETGVKEEKK